MNIASFFKPKETGAGTADTPSTSSSKSESAPSTSTSKTQGVLPSSISKTDTLKAEILWCLKVVEDHQSFHSCQGNNELFRRMFPDSAIAKNFQLSESKCKYMTVFGLGPYVQDLVRAHIKESSHYVILFDESLNQKLQSKQMDFLIRTWQNNEVHTRYLTSVFIGHGTALHLQEELTKVLQSVGLNKLLQISMDGPNVNWRMYEDFGTEYKAELNQNVLNLGSCGLHIVNGAFVTGAVAADWDVETFLSSLYYLFKDSPARREDFQKVTGCSDMPLRFCKTRWLENVPPAERALEIWESVIKYVKAVEGKKIPNSKNKSFEVVQKCTKVALFPARLHFFLSVAKMVNPYLTDYQTDKPMMPFMADDLTRVLSSIMKKFLKLDKATVNSAYNLIKVDVDSESIQRPVSNIDIGFHASKLIQELKVKKKISERQALEFNMDAKKFLSTMTKKLIERCPLKYALVRNLSCLDPKQMVKNKDRATSKMKRVMSVLHDAKRVEDHDIDDVVRQYEEACDSAASDPAMANFDKHAERLDVVLYTFFTSKPAFSSLWKIVSMLLILSHGQASIERGFSVNKHVEEDNLQEQSLISLRAVFDHIKYVGGIQNISLTNKLIVNAAAGRQRYHQYLDEKKRDEEKAKNDNKRKEAVDQLEELKAKRVRLQNDVKSLQKSADEYAEKAEARGHLTLITKSNSLRRTAKDKIASLEQLDKQIESQLSAMRNS